MKCLLKLLIFLALYVALSKGQIFQQNEKCKTFRDPFDCNAYYQCCLDDVALHQFCPVGMEWNTAENNCEKSDLCGNYEALNGVKDRDSENENIDLENEFFLTCMLRASRKRPRPPIVRPPGSGSGSNNSNQMKSSKELVFTLILVKLVIFFILSNLNKTR